MTRRATLRVSLESPSPKPSLPIPALLGAALCLYLIFGDTQGCSLIGKPPPYPVPTTLPGAVAVGIDGGATAVASLTKDYPGVLAAIQQRVEAKGGQYREIDTSVDKKPTMDMDWVQAAWDKMDKAHPPRIIGATPKKGLPDQPLPKTPDEVNKLLDQLGL